MRPPTPPDDHRAATEVPRNSGHPQRRRGGWRPGLSLQRCRVADEYRPGPQTQSWPVHSDLAAQAWCPRQDLNLRSRLRRPVQLRSCLSMVSPRSVFPAQGCQELLWYRVVHCTNPCTTSIAGRVQSMESAFRGSPQAVGDPNGVGDDDAGERARESRGEWPANGKP